MPTLVLRFPAGRYHATPWGHHVNEGLAEWPPSPWRILRALLSVGYTTLHWQSAPPEAISLLEKLAGVLPRYVVPPATLAQSRHYMPLAKFKKAREDTTLVFDTWVRVGDGTLAVTWELELEPAEEKILSQLAENLGYLGRSESWTEARLASPNEPLPEGLAVEPEERADGAAPAPGCEVVTLLAAMSPEAYRAWRRPVVERALEAHPLPAGKRKPSASLLKKRARAEEPFPATLPDCLQAETRWLQRHGWGQPPGSRRIAYRRPARALEVGVPQHLRAVVSGQPVEAMLLAISLPSGNLGALPSRVRTLPQGDLVHRGLVAWVNRLDVVSEAPELLGHDSGRRVLAGHRHAHVLPLDLDGDAHLDHVLIWAPSGLSGKAQQVIRALRRTFAKGGVEDLLLAVAGLGSFADLTQLPAPFGEALMRVVAPPEGARVWETLTPFVPPRFLKRGGPNTLEGQIQAELASRGLARAAVIPFTREQVVAEGLHHYVRTRSAGRSQPPQDVCFGARLVFKKPVNGPICLGYASHFGMGIFRALWE